MSESKIIKRKEKIYGSDANGKPLSPAALQAPAVASTLALTLLTGCGCTSTAKPETPSVSAAVPVTTQAVRVGNVARVLTVNGSLLALQDVAISAKQGGRVAETTVRQGDTVSAGQILARIDSADLRSQVRADEAAVVSARAKITQAEAAYGQQRKTTETTIASAQAA